MGRRSSTPKERKHVHLTVGAWDRLTELYQGTRITPSSVIAQLVDFHIRRVEEKANIKLANLESTVESVEISNVDD